MATFDREQASSDGGAILLKAADRVYGLVETFARCLVDRRAPEKIRHTLEDLVGQRVFGIAYGHPDGNDADRLADDPIHKLLLGPDPVAGARLASQPTVSRFENNAGRVALYRLGRELAASVIERHPRRRAGGRARRITMDLDPTRTRAEVFGPRESSPAASWAPVEDGGVVAQQPAPLRRTGSPCRDRIGLLDGDCRRVARVYPDRPAASLPHLSWSASRCRISQKTLTQSLGAGCRNSRIVGYQGVSVRPSIQRQSWANTSAPPTCGTSLRRF